MKEQQKIMKDLNELFNQLVVVGFSRNIVETTIDEIRNNKSKLNEKECKNQLEAWEEEAFKIEKEFYKFCKTNHSEYYQNKSGTEVFCVMNYYFSFHFGRDMVFATDIKNLSSEITSRLAKIDN